MQAVARIHSFIVQKYAQKIKLHHSTAGLFDSFLLSWGPLRERAVLFSPPPPLSTKPHTQTSAERTQEQNKKWNYHCLHLTDSLKRVIFSLKAYEWIGISNLIRVLFTSTARKYAPIGHLPPFSRTIAATTTTNTVSLHCLHKAGRD